ncbi:hypothetical protein CSKR_203073 [Clonorchis sinensis]|uniref:Uncharacterized protein n=1 Tax=Clonorchis sinensis TaxID=79923 RepID=A0A8T1M5T5_CLOSI|nr:hypothetical protein CSKR_203073 [Clonorchis sinensis]
MHMVFSSPCQMDTVAQWKDDDLSFMEKYPNGVPLLEMIPFYEAVARNEPLKLEWTCPGKRDPKSDEKPEPSVPTSFANTCKSDSLESQSAAAKLAEFDFDESSNQPFFSPAGVGVTQPLRKVLGPGRHPPRQPRVANMDKILNDLFRSRKETVSVPIPESSQRPSAMSVSPPDRDDNEPPALMSHDLPTGCAQAHQHTGGADLSVDVGNAVTSAEPSVETNVGVVATTPSSAPVDPHAFTSESHTSVAESVSSIDLPPNGISSETFQSEHPAQPAHAQIAE